MGEAVVRITSLLAAAGGSCSRGCTTQDKLHWWGKGLGDDECVALAERLQEPGRPRLKHLLLGSNYVGDRCIHALSSAARNGALKSLYALGLSRNRITDVGCEALAGAMRAGQLPQLTDLYISRNRVGNGCAAALASVLRIPRAPPLKRIGLGDGSADEAGLSSLLAAQLEELVGLVAAEPASYGARLPSRLRTVALLIGSASGAEPLPGRPPKAPVTLRCVPTTQAALAAQPARASSRREVNLSNNSGLCAIKEAEVRATSLVAGAGLAPLTTVSVACSRARGVRRPARGRALGQGKRGKRRHQTR